MLQLGKVYTLQVVEFADFGVYLGAGEGERVLLPRRHVPAGAAIGDDLRVFVYLDSEDRPVATTKMPNAMVGQFAYLPVVDRNAVGAFLDWGLEKDLLVPFMEQHRPMEEERSYLVYIYVDKVHGRIVASSKIDKFLDDDKPHRFNAGQAVDLIIANSTDLGFKAIINHRHWGVLHSADVSQRLSFGQSIRGYIKHVRPDGRIDLSLRPAVEVLDEQGAVIVAYLEKQDGFAPVHDKSSPEEIARLFHISKAAFKKAIGRLYKQGVIEIRPDGIQLCART
ncbi:CvfB family protein [Pseudohongiella sp.]|uniref:S1 motif domain-containing protein n=1 Tax=marine sediment metagenome TaxID=412755 RepID=A0A0F9V1J7_9ZZZZ|nr:S1-like domain-containing RNA-binding protein [Pseudohongiella sp.]HDZ08906.1 GntR family transcriptional regulator [Pseudohongiella sp.]HEA64016.1 GntR family transcriptional regulator [Pseudohongiella sp.]